MTAGVVNRCGKGVLQLASAVLFRTNRCFLRNFSASPKMSKKAVVFLAAGAEEMEAVIAIDVLRRGGVEVTVSGVGDSQPVTCSRNIVIVPDAPISSVMKAGPYDALVLPGGLKGSENLANSKEVGQMLKEQEAAGRIIAAICAAPTALKSHGVAKGKNVTSYPAMAAAMKEGGDYKYHEDDVVVDGNVITSRGPGTAFKFALTLVEHLSGKAKAQECAKGMLLDY